MNSVRLQDDTIKIIVDKIFYAGTHDVQNVSVSSPHPGEIRVTGGFVEGSNATAALLVVYSTSNNTDTIYRIVSGPGGNIDIAFNVSTGGDYEVSVFALENGRPFSRVVTLPRPVHVDGSYEFEGTYGFSFRLQMCT